MFTAKISNLIDLQRNPHCGIVKMEKYEKTRLLLSIAMMPVLLLNKILAIVASMTLMYAISQRRSSRSTPRHYHAASPDHLMDQIILRVRR